MRPFIIFKAQEFWTGKYFTCGTTFTGVLLPSQSNVTLFSGLWWKKTLMTMHPKCYFYKQAWRGDVGRPKNLLIRAGTCNWDTKKTETAGIFCCNKLIQLKEPKFPNNSDIHIYEVWKCVFILGFIAVCVITTLFRNPRAVNDHTKFLRVICSPHHSAWPDEVNHNFATVYEA